MAEQDRPARKKRRPAPVQGIDFVTPLLALGTALLMMGVAFGFSEGVRYATARKVPDAAADDQSTNPSEGRSNSTATPETLAPDPGSPTLPVPSAGPGLPVNGEPLFASGDALFFVDTPLLLGVPVPDRVSREPAEVPVHDLTAGKPLGILPSKARRVAESLLSPDGRFLVAFAAGQAGKSGSFEVWPVGAPAPTGTLAPRGQIFWMDFVGPDELAVATHDRTGSRLVVYRVSACKDLRTFSLPTEVFPASWSPTHREHQPYRHRGAVSPGRKYVALGGLSEIAIVSLTTGKVLGKLPLGFGGANALYRGLSFSLDGTRLDGVFFAPANDRLGTMHTRLKSWNMTDGSQAVDVELPNPNVYGPPLPGPGPGTLLVPMRRIEDMKHLWTALVVDASTGKTIRDLPYLPVCWLAEGRLLVVGPIKDAPPGTPLPGPPPDGADPVLWDQGQRNDPAVRAVYSVELPLDGG
jgi:hypothetical protein